MIYKDKKGFDQTYHCCLLISNLGSFRVNDAAPGMNNSAYYSKDQHAAEALPYYARTRVPRAQDPEDPASKCGPTIIWVPISQLINEHS